MTARSRNKRKRKPPPHPSAGSKKTTRAARKPPPVPRGARLWLFRILAVTVVPGVLLGLVEIGLRIGGYGNPTTAMVKAEIGGRSVWHDNQRFSWQFFPWHIARTAMPYVFDAKKATNACRIFILGASAAQGTPDSAFAFGRILATMLRERYPGVKFEVINTAMVATNSHVVRRIAMDCAKHQPDLFVVYLGNNEVVGPFGAGTVFTPLSGNLKLIRFGIAFKTTRIGQLLSNTTGQLAGDGGPAVWTGMDMYLEKQVRADDPSLQTVYSHFRRNLQDIRDIAVAAGAKIIFSSVGVNFSDNPPFASLHRADLSDAELKQWQQHYDQGTALEEEDKFKEALAAYLAAAQIDETFADLQFRMATCYSRQGDFDNATDRYVRAREYDTLRFRADSQINAIIQSVAVENACDNTYFVDTSAALQDESPHGITGEKFFYEHVHMKFAGNYILARTVLQQTEDILPEHIRARKAPDAKILTEQQCRDRLVNTLLDEHRNAEMILTEFVKRPPFTNQLYHNRHVEDLESQLATMKTRLTDAKLAQIDMQFKNAIARGHRNWWLHWKYAGLLSNKLHNQRAAVVQYRLVLDMIPHCSQALTLLAKSLGKLGDLDSAIALDLEAIRLNPAFAIAHYNLGVSYQARGNLDKAIRHYAIVIRFKPDHANAYNNTAVILYRQGKTDEAITTFQKAQELITDVPYLYYNLGKIFAKSGRIDEAIEQYRAALKIDPDLPKIKKALEVALRKNK